MIKYSTVCTLLSIFEELSTGDLILNETFDYANVSSHSLSMLIQTVKISQNNKSAFIHVYNLQCSLSDLLNLPLCVEFSLPKINFGSDLSPLI